MDRSPLDRRGLLRGAGVIGVAAAMGTGQSAGAVDEAPPVSPPTPPLVAPPAGYVSFRPIDAAFFEALVDHMIPADDLTPGGVELGVAQFIDRAMDSGYGRGDRLYSQGPWQQGTPNQGYQLALAPAALLREGVEQAEAYCRRTYAGKSFAGIDSAQKDELLKGLASGKIVFDNGLPAAAFFAELYDHVMQGFFADPAYGGNRGKASWQMVGFPGVIAVNQRAIVTYRGKPYPARPLSMADVG